MMLMQRVRGKVLVRDRFASNPDDTLNAQNENIQQKIKVIACARYNVERYREIERVWNRGIVGIVFGFLFAAAKLWLA